MSTQEQYPTLSSNQKILLVTAKRVGDALFLTPAIKLLKQSLPATQLDVLALGKSAADVFEHNPMVNRIFLTKNKKTIKKIANQYSLVINLMHEMQVYLTDLSAPVVSIGLPNQNLPRAEQVLDFILTLLENNNVPQKIDHEYNLYPQTHHVQNINTLLRRFDLDPSKHILIACQLGCHRVARRGWQFWRKKKDRHQHEKVWSIENYIELAKQLCESDQRIRLILTGAKQEKFLARLVQKDCPEVISFIGKTELLELTALMDQLQVLITHDTGTLHIACARQRPIVALFGPTPVAFTGPYPMKPQYTVLQQDRMADITVTDVYQAVMEKLLLVN
jgi:ADP-heptose:LPS heptosyltransferase